MPKLFIGPWIGEFGVELMRWQGRARAIAAESQWDEVIVATRRENFFIYADFASRCVAFEPGTIHTGGRDCLDHNFKDLGEAFQPGPEDLHLTPFITEQQWQEFELTARQNSRFINYAKRSGLQDTNRSFDILIHARASEKVNQQFKNWPVEAWKEFVCTLGQDFKIGSIGSPEGAHHIEGTEDLRGISLEELSGYLGKVKLLVGPSSGPMHLAMLCETPLVTWADQTGSHVSHWNPFQVPICILPGWAPRPEVVCSKVRQMLRLSAAKPSRFILSCPSGTNYHQFIDWLKRKVPSNKQMVMHDCITDFHHGYPRFKPATPIKKLTPKYLNEPNLTPQIEEAASVNISGELLPVVFDMPMGKWVETLRHHPGARGIVLLEDLGSTLMRLKSEWRGFYDTWLPEDAFKHVADLYQSLLETALKKADPGLAGILFVSLNRLRHDAEYCKEISALLLCDQISDEPPQISLDVAAKIGAKLIGGRFRQFVGQRKLGGLEKRFHHFEPKALAHNNKSQMPK
jgi:hypothetical protein